MPFGSLLVQRDQWDTYWGAKQIIFLIRDIDGPAMAKLHGLMVAGSGLKPKLARCSNRKINEARKHLAIGNQM